MSRPLKVFCGYDAREAHGFHVFVQSLLDQATIPVEIIPLTGLQRDGTNRFTYARFLVPHLCGHRGSAIFLDGADMLLRSDIAELAALIDPRYAVQVVQHDYKTKHPRKYLGTPMECANEDYPRKNWSSVVIWNMQNAQNHMALTEKEVGRAPGSYLHRFEWLRSEQIGALPAEWNHLVGEQEYSEDAKLVHFTLGIPAFPAYADCDYSSDYWDCSARFGL